MIIKTDDENEVLILQAYRKLNGLGRRTVLDYLSFVLQLDKYTLPETDSNNSCDQAGNIPLN